MMFCIVDEVSGLSSGFVDCPQELIAANTPKGCLATPAEGVEVGNYLFENGKLLPIGEPPSLQHIYRRGEGWVLQQQSVEATWQAVRRQRDDLLAATDWRVVRAVETGQPLPMSWQGYRKALRDISQQQYPNNITWPALPEER